MKLGAEDKKKVGILALLGLLAVYLLYTNLLSDSSSPKPAEKPRPGIAATGGGDVLSPSGSGAAPAPSANIRRATPGRTSRGDEFHPTLRSKRPEERVDPSTIDPTLRLDLLAKVQGVDPAGGSRNVFQFSAPPPPKAAELKGPEPKVPLKVQGPKTAEQAKAADPSKPPKPPPPPINLKYYGFSSPQGSTRKTAFFLDGEDILVAPEGEMLKKRYRVVRIGVNSVLMEDTVSNSQQSLPLQEDLPGVG